MPCTYACGACDISIRLSSFIIVLICLYLTAHDPQVAQWTTHLGLIGDGVSGVAQFGRVIGPMIGEVGSTGGTPLLERPSGMCLINGFLFQYHSGGVLIVKIGMTLNEQDRLM